MTSPVFYTDTHYFPQEKTILQIHGLDERTGFIFTHFGSMVLSSEVIEWCDDNDIEFEENGVNPNSPVDLWTLEITFPKPSDAIMFKLRWL